ncbi:DUF6336 family protein [Streptomyces sp. 7N604]|uniref:DUF6336 family protein n=1 Tax=Streptomyces sp. 7N604 TaxID=3457415 RepID=UPI003FD38940
MCCGRCPAPSPSPRTGTRTRPAVLMERSGSIGGSRGIADHHDRQVFLSAVGGIGLLFGASVLFVGAGFWWASAGDIRRWRDWRTITGQTTAVTVVGPPFVRLGMLLLVLGPAAIGLHHVVDAAPYGSWMHSY